MTEFRSCPRGDYVAEFKTGLEGLALLHAVQLLARSRSRRLLPARLVDDELRLRLRGLIGRFLLRFAPSGGTIQAFRLPDTRFAHTGADTVGIGRQRFSNKHAKLRFGCALKLILR